MEVPCGSSVVATTSGYSIYCDDCGCEKLAEVKDGKLIIYDRRHGQKHFVVVSLKELMEKK